MPKSANFKQFSGFGLKTRRTYVASKVDVEKEKKVNFQGGMKGVAGGGLSSLSSLKLSVIQNPLAKTTLAPDAFTALRLTTR